MREKSALLEKQLSAIDWMYDNDEGLIIAPKGFGKCVVGATTIQELITDHALERVLVLSTAQVCRETWGKEANEWEHLQAMAVLTGLSPAQRLALLDDETNQIVVCNFDNLQWLVESGLLETFDGLLIDEITKLKSVGGAGYKKFRKHIKQFKWRFGMTADPVAQESQDIYGQMLMLDYGKRLGRNKERFLREYFMQMDFHGRKWEFQPGARERLAEVLSDVIYKVDAEDYTESLPLLENATVPVRMPEQARFLYNALARDNFINVHGHDVEAPNAGVLMAKMHQLCNGAIYVDDEVVDDAGEVTTHTVTIDIHNAKMEALDKLLKRFEPPVLIAYLFDFQRRAIEEKYGFPTFSAKNSTAQNNELMKQWNEGSLRGMIVHPKSAGHGLNLQYGPCHALIQMSHSWSADEEDQMIGRIWRRGQKSDIVHRYTIVAENTLEDSVMIPRLRKREKDSQRFHDYITTLQTENAHVEDEC